MTAMTRMGAVTVACNCSTDQQIVQYSTVQYSTVTVACDGSTDQQIVRTLGLLSYHAAESRAHNAMDTFTLR